MSTIITFPGSPERKPAAGVVESTPVQTEFGSGRSRKAVQVDIDAHVKARKAYGKAVAWALATEAGEAEAYQIEEARQNTAMAYREMQDAARNLLICMPTDPKGACRLADVPGEQLQHTAARSLTGRWRCAIASVPSAENGPSLAAPHHEIRHARTESLLMKRRRRSIRKRHRQRIAGHARRLSGRRYPSRAPT